MSRLFDSEEFSQHHLASVRVVGIGLIVGVGSGDGFWCLFSHVNAAPMRVAKLWSHQILLATNQRLRVKDTIYF
jgi:hypothetical protein